MAPDPRRRLNDGVLIRASVLARVLGVRLLTVDTTVVLVPADVQVPAAARHDPAAVPAKARAAIAAPTPPRGLGVDPGPPVGAWPTP
ncbi:MAG: hypothetical protein WAL63_13305 [Solirubrobacteraceae bacterium]